jgi:hypothetical protein
MKRRQLRAETFHVVCMDRVTPEQVSEQERVISQVEKLKLSLSQLLECIIRRLLTEAFHAQHPK